MKNYSNMMKDFKIFEQWFKGSSLWTKMENTKECSPWHREDSVAIHTEMTVAQFLEKVENNHISRYSAPVSEHTKILVMTALLFHDTGKPSCKVEKMSKDRGTYFAFHGHELRSTRMLENYFCTNKKMMSKFLTIEDLYKVMWMVENHLPYDRAKDPKKMRQLTDAAYRMLGDDYIGFCYHLLADSYGRISDDATEKLESVNKFVDRFLDSMEDTIRDLENADLENPDAPTLTFMIGPSGCGKSAYSKKHEDTLGEYYSFDQIRINLAEKKIPNEMRKASQKSEADYYNTAFRYCDTHRSEFGHAIDVEFNRLMELHNSVVIDNTNTTRKARNRFIVDARRYGYNIKAVMFPISLYDVINRQIKGIPSLIIRQQYNMVSIPWFGLEVDDIEICTDNLKKY